MFNLKQTQTCKRKNVEIEARNCETHMTQVIEQPAPGEDIEENCAGHGDALPVENVH
jgi:hypothetical protein